MSYNCPYRTCCFLASGGYTIPRDTWNNVLARTQNILHQVADGQDINLTPRQLHTLVYNPVDIQRNPLFQNAPLGPPEQVVIWDVEDYFDDPFGEEEPPA